MVDWLTSSFAASLWDTPRNRVSAVAARCSAGMLLSVWLTSSVTWLADVV